MYCTQCAEVIPEGSRFCAMCAAPAPTRPVATSASPFAPAVGDTMRPVPPVVRADADPFVDTFDDPAHPRVSWTAPTVPTYQPGPVGPPPQQWQHAGPAQPQQWAQPTSGFGPPAGGPLSPIPGNPMPPPPGWLPGAAPVGPTVGAASDGTEAVVAALILGVVGAMGLLVLHVFWSVAPNSLRYGSWSRIARPAVTALYVAALMGLAFLLGGKLARVKRSGANVTAGLCIALYPLAVLATELVLSMFDGPISSDYGTWRWQQFGLALIVCVGCAVVVGVLGRSAVATSIVGVRGALILVATFAGGYYRYGPMTGVYGNPLLVDSRLDLTTTTAGSLLSAVVGVVAGAIAAAFVWRRALALAPGEPGGAHGRR